MREILFRGKRKDNGKWVEGWFLGAECTTGIIDDNHDIWPVTPETVGEYTGLHDKNGKKIFEGDILTYPPDMEHYGEQYKYVVKYENSCLVGNSYFWCMLSDGFGESEVIGNIHDNPELLEVE